MGKKPDVLIKQIRKLTKLRDHLQPPSSSSASFSNEEVSRLLDKVAKSLLLNLTEERARHDTQLLILKEEMKLDAVDHEANLAKTVDRHRIASERGERISTVFLKSIEAVKSIDEEMITTCPFYNTRIVKALPAFVNSSVDQETPASSVAAASAAASSSTSTDPRKPPEAATEAGEAEAATGTPL